MPQNQSNDPTIEEVREARHRISEKCGHDPERLVAYYMKLQEQYRERLIGQVEPAASTQQSAA